MTIPYLSVKIDPYMTIDTFAMYLEFMILWHIDVRDNSWTDFDRRWKQGQIDLLQDMVDEIDGIVKPTPFEEIMKMMNDMEFADEKPY